MSPGEPLGCDHLHSRREPELEWRCKGSGFLPVRLPVRRNWRRKALVYPVGVSGRALASPARRTEVRGVRGRAGCAARHGRPQESALESANLLGGMSERPKEMRCKRIG